ncbi:MAG TPA: DUF4398 domain-containing protein [Steroidobacteraceae bacterium]|nr:DUF4398 domain-containing protein [Steroidobacteraceae bacterium]
MYSPSKRTSVSRRRLRIALPVLVLVASTAFARPPVPTTNLQAAQQAIANAERVDAATLAGVELGEARGKLAAAQRAVEEKEMVVAQQFADEARAGAELAAAKSGAAKAVAVNKDIERSTATLIDEMQRKTGESR